MSKYLIFRTDRIGDFLLSLILIHSIKQVDNKSHITVVASYINYNFIKSFDIIDDVILLRSNLFGKLNLILKLRKHIFDFIIIHDAKKRSKFINFFLKSKNNYLSDINNFSSYIDEIKYILKKLKLNFKEINLNTLKNRDYSKFKIPNKPYIILHFDEKWIFSKYIRKYTKIEPNLNELQLFLNSLYKKSKKKIIVTTGIYTPNILLNFFQNNSNKNINLIKNLNFFALESLIDSSSLLISCHGAVSHVASAKNIKQIDIIDKGYNYNKWTNHFRNYTSLNRKKFSILYKDILELL